MVNELTYTDLASDTHSSVKRSTEPGTTLDEDYPSSTDTKAESVTSSELTESFGTTIPVHSVSARGTAGHEDEEPDDAEYSGSEGSAGLEISRAEGTSTTTIPTERTHGAPRFYRMTMVVHEPWSPALDDRRSSDFKQLADRLVMEIYKLFESVPGKHTADVINMQKGPDILKIRVTVDLGSTVYDKNLINSTMYNGLREYRLGDFTIDRDEYAFRVFRGCMSDELTCRGDDQCLPIEKRCDGQSDCADGSDELGCESVSLLPTPHECTSDERRCGSGECVANSKRCDGISDCLDGSDEQGCKKGLQRDSCRADDQVTCSDGSYSICNDQKCDGKPDCPDGDDEKDCPKEECAHDEFMCDVSRCIPKTFECDGKEDCADRTDELYCITTTPKACGRDQFQCDSGDCIDAIKRCDGRFDCPGGRGDDERNCNSCSEGYFKCGNGVCITDRLRCDGTYHCSDRSDEFGCNGTLGCTSQEFRCRNGDCILKTHQCDRNPDCKDGSDEENCSCRSDQFRCSDGRCLSMTAVCNQKWDCSGGEDEQHCSPTCAFNEFQCRSGQCLDKSKYCDGRRDCPDNSDEGDFCGALECKGFWCDDGITCLPNNVKCDGIPDCTDNSDEKNCGCRLNEFTCGDGSCIDERQKCDGRPDCRDRSDEFGCDCRFGEYRCGSGECIQEERHCDGHSDCSDRSDEYNCAPSTLAPSPACSYDQFTCHSDRRCIPQSAVCNGRYDCADYSDELSCAGRPSSSGLKLMTYPPEQIIKERREVVFQCRDEGPLRARVKWSRPNNLSLPPNYKDLNGRLEMPNIQLEHSGNYTCVAVDYIGVPGSSRTVQLRVEQYTHPTSSHPRPVCGIHEATCYTGECIDKHRVCDGNYDCPDGSDEDRCNPDGCEPNEFQCANKKCVMKTWRCDADDDCGDNSDEMNCATNPPGSKCHYHEFACQHKDLNQCIPKSFHCDGEVDCQDGSDESSCRPVEIIDAPKRMEMLPLGDNMTLTCRAIGVPTPLIVWRLNWGHVPPKCTSTSEGGLGTLFCPDVRESDQGAYTCEALNMRRREMAVPDTILVVIGRNDSVCAPGSFNDDARNNNECISCFCFGITTKCNSANLFTYQLPPPIDSAEVLSVQVHPRGHVEILADQTSNLPRVRSVDRNVFQIYSSTIEREGFRLGENVYPYFAMPENYHRNQLKTYGGYLKYSVKYEGTGNPVDIPDVILRGNNYTLVHRSALPSPSTETEKAVRFFSGEWYRNSVSGELASREDIMMALRNVDSLLLRTQYVDGPILDTYLTNIRMDSAGIVDVDQGRASFVEECQCPKGYTGLSCEDCAPDFERRTHGSWLGLCLPRDEPCPPGYLKNRTDGSCEKCPCPHTNPSNNFASTCYLDTDGQVTCNCLPQYIGRRCEKCAEGYHGNPFVPGSSCERVDCDTSGTLTVTSGSCVCKTHVTGTYCNQCKPNTFHLDSSNQFGCIDCFCMGITRECVSSNLYRQQVTAYFTTNTQGVKLIEASKRDEPISTDIDVDPRSREIVYKDFSSRRSSDAYYWQLPDRFRGNKITSYGGNLTYTIRFVPTPGGSHSRNNAADVELINSDAAIHLLYFSRVSWEANRPQTIVVPLYEHYWQRQDGEAVDRAHMLMALANLQDVLIKATYTTNTHEAALQYVSLDIADTHNTGQERASSVEQCNCPVGYRGLSCEECAVGYTRDERGIYLGLCVPCDCNGHSVDCDSETGICIDCAGHTTGDHCERCLPGYVGDPKEGSCSPRSSETCYCDPRGSLSPVCRDGRCECKTNVLGEQCDVCRPGTYGLSVNNPEGCVSCFCMGVTDECSSSSLYRTQIPVGFIDTNHGFKLMDSNRQVHVETGLVTDWARNEIHYEFRPPTNQQYFWSLPSSFTGNKITSYGGNLTFTQHYTATADAELLHDKDVILFGNGMSIFWKDFEAAKPGIPQTKSIQLSESANWFLSHSSIPRASRHNILTVLASLEAVLIRASHSTQTRAVYISDVSLDTALPNKTPEGRAFDVEMCRCPAAYSGLSCESCAPGYFRNSSDLSESVLGSCRKCLCNGNEESCSMSSGMQLVCQCKPGFVGPDCRPQGPPEPVTRPPYVSSPPPRIAVTIEEPTIRIVEVGNTVRFHCTARPLVSREPVRVSWSKEGGNLPRDRATDDGEGILVIISVVASDSGTYVCTASDGSSYVTERATLTVGGSTPAAPEVTISPPFLEVREGEPVELRCHASGNPLPVLSWTGGASHPTSFRNGVFRIASARRSDEGEYHCTATNSVGSNTQRTILYVREGTSPGPEPSVRLSIIPPEYTGAAGDTVRLACVPGNHGYHRVEWSRAGGQGLPTTASQEDQALTIFNASPDDSGIYVCTVTSPSGARDQIQARVSIATTRGPPTARIEPESQTISQGTTAELRCITSGEPAPSVWWSKAGEQELGSNVQVLGSVLKVLIALPHDRGVYVCNARNEGGTAQAGAILEVERREPPLIEIYPDRHQTVRLGESPLIQCRVVNGIPTPSVVWRRADGRSISSLVEKLPNGVLRFKHVTTAEAGEYLCEAQNDIGVVNSTAFLDIISAPTIRLTPSTNPLVVNVGQRVRLECSAQGEPRPTVYWSRNTPGYLHFEPTNLTAEPSLNAVHEITRVSKADEGYYSCTARSKAGIAEEQLKLVVEESNEIDRLPERGDIAGEDSGRHPNRFTVRSGGNAQLRCDTAANNTKIYVTWTRPGSPLPEGHSVRDGALFLNNVKMEDAGNYVCTAYENGRQLFEAPAMLIVLGIPQLELHPPHQVVRPGDNARVTCRVLGSVPSTITWIQVGHPGETLPSHARDHNGVLEFEHIGPHDSGRYMCRASNEYGTAEAVAEVIVQDGNHITSIVTAENHDQVVHEGASAHLRCLPSPDTEVTWTYEGGRLPENADQNGAELSLYSVRVENAGRYECQARSHSGVGSDYINLRVDAQPVCLADEFPCPVGGRQRCMPLYMQCDNHSDCDDRRDEHNCSSSSWPGDEPRRGRETDKVELQIFPSRDIVHLGDNLDVRCSVIGDPYPEVLWTKVGSRFAPNVHTVGDVLRITDVKPSNGGVYRCNARSSNRPLSEDYTLSIQAPHMNAVDAPPVETRTAAYGMTVLMDCRTDLEPPVKYTWSKQGGALPRDAVGDMGPTLSIPEVRAQDAGFYVCTAQNDEVKIDLPTVLVVTGVVPYFAQAPNSYMALPTLLDAYLSFNISVSFKPESSNGLILYNGQQSGGSGDFVSLGLNGGFMEFRFDVGSGPAVIKSARPVSLGQWHTVRLIRNRKDGEMFVDGAGPYRGTAAGRFQGLDLVEPLYLGGVPDFRTIHRLAGHSQGFVGCISQLLVGSVEHELNRDATTTEGVTTCETCAVNPCQHNGVCQEAPSPNGYTCICPPGFSGDDCSKIGQSCYPGACGSGRCINVPSGGFKCLCPIGKMGFNCENDIVVNEPAFANRAYIAYPTPKTPRKFKMTLRINPTEIRDSLIMYSAQNNDGSGDFVALSIKDGHLEFRFDAGSGTTVIRSNRELRRNEWVTVTIVRDTREGRLSIDGEQPVAQRTHGTSKPLHLQTPLYIGGYDSQKIKLAPGVNVDNGFTGCVSEVEVPGFALDLVSSSLDAANVEDCSIKHGQRGGRGSGGNPCTYAPCLNGGHCTSLGHRNYSCSCLEGFSGKDCEIESDMCLLLQPCLNGGTCIGSPSSYKCNCPRGYGGTNCNNSVTFTSQVNFPGDGWLELSRELLPHKSATESEVISIRFSTNDSNSLVLWYGQTPEVDGRGQDYLSLSIVDGHLVWSYELGSGPAHIRLNTINVNDERPHTVVLRRQAREGSIELDGIHSERGQSGGTLTQLNTNGNIYIGGVPNMNLMTGNAHLHGFSGCVHSVQIQHSKVLNLYEEALASSNVLACPKSSGEELDEEYEEEYADLNEGEAAQ